MRHRLLLASSDADLTAELTALAQEGAELELVDKATDAGAVIPTLMRREVDVVLLHELLGADAIAEVARQVATRFPHIAVLLIAREETQDVLKLAVRAGARDVLSLPLSLEQLEASARDAAEWSQTIQTADAGARAPGRAVDSRIVALAGAKGGVGTTTVALQLALASLDPSGDRSVCLVDFDLQAGDLRSLLNLPPRRSVIDLAGVGEEISARHLEDTLHTHKTGLRVLLAPDEGELGEEVNGAAARAILGALRQWHDLVVVDLGTAVTEANAVAAEMSNRALIVATPDVPALRGANRLTDLWWRLEVREPDEVTIVLNRTSRKTEVQPDFARTVVKGTVAETTIPAQFWALEGAANSGHPERMAGEKVLRPYVELARSLVDADPGESRAAAPEGEVSLGG
jgi:pilus assembly protein CpaE